MKAVVSAQRPDIDALVDPRFGRAPWLVVVDVESGAWSAHANDAEGERNAGLAAAATAIELGADAVVTGNVGPNAHHVLTTRGLGVHQAGNGVTVRDAVAALADGRLAGLAAPSVAGGWS